MTADALPEQMRTRWVAHSQSLLNSYRERVALDLFDRSGHAADEAERLFLAPFVVVSHGVEADPTELRQSGRA